MNSQKFLPLCDPIRLVAFDFDGVFTDNTVYISQSGEESVRCYRSDDIGLSKLLAFGLRAVILSRQPSPFMQIWSDKLGVPCLPNVHDKMNSLQLFINPFAMSLGEVAYVGNDVTDLELLQNVHFPIAVRDAYQDVKAVAAYTTLRSGGQGAVREVCDLIVDVKRDRSLI